MRHAAFVVLALLSACAAASSGNMASDTAGAPGISAGDAGTSGSPSAAGDSATAAAAGRAADDGGAAGAAEIELPSGSGGAAGSGGANAQGGGTCTTRIGYGDRWIHPSNHPIPYDNASYDVTWDGKFTIGTSTSTATLSNGWKPAFAGTSGCVLSLDSSCVSSNACITRISYGSTWNVAAGHTVLNDDVAGHVFWDGKCTPKGTDESTATLSNGWGPTFKGSNACQLSFQYRNCGGLYLNPVRDDSCPDPGVIFDGTRYVAGCTGGGADAFPLFESTDLVHWSAAGNVFSAAQKPTWASGDFWAPEIHRVGTKYLAYFTARQKNGRLAIGVATGDSATGPFTDSGAPLVTDATLGLIDATQFEDAESGTRYLVWKVDGNAASQPTPIYAQPLNADGTQLTGTKTQLITNDKLWEGGVVEAPWVLHHGSYYYLFYSGNSYANETYALGVARSSKALGPYTKLAAPLLITNDAWVGPGHGSVLDLANGRTYVIYHAWKPGHVNGPGDARVLLVDQVFWTSDGWPRIPSAPSANSRPMP